MERYFRVPYVTCPSRPPPCWRRHYHRPQPPPTRAVCRPAPNPEPCLDTPLLPWRAHRLPPLLVHSLQMALVPPPPRFRCRPPAEALLPR